MTKTDLIAAAAPIAASLALAYHREKKPLSPSIAAKIGCDAMLIAAAVLTAADSTLEAVNNG